LLLQSIGVDRRTVKLFEGITQLLRLARCRVRLEKKDQIGLEVLCVVQEVRLRIVPWLRLVADSNSQKRLLDLAEGILAAFEILADGREAPDQRIRSALLLVRNAPSADWEWITGMRRGLSNA